MRILRNGMLTLATAGFILGCMSGLSGCGSKPSDGTMVEGAGPPTEEQKALHKKFYTRKATAKKAGRR